MNAQRLTGGGVFFTTGEVYAIEDSHVTHMPPARLVGKGMWFWDHDVWSHPGELWPVSLRPAPDFRGMYDKLGHLVIRLKVQPDPHIVNALPAVDAMREIPIPINHSPEALAVAVKEMEAALPDFLLLDVVPHQRFVDVWDRYEPDARARWVNDPNRQVHERFMSDADRELSRRVVADASK